MSFLSFASHVPSYFRGRHAGENIEATHSNWTNFLKREDLIYPEIWLNLSLQK